MNRQVSKPFIFPVSFFFMLMATLISCHTLKPLKAPASPLPASEITHKDYKSPRALSNYMKQNEFKYNWMTSRFSADVDLDGNSSSFNVSVRAKSDSAIWMSVSVFGIEGARMLITTDSVKFIDRVNSKYFIGDYTYLSKLVNTEVDFDMLESVLIGNSVEFYDEDEKLRASKDSVYYMLSTVRKRKIRKALNKAAAGVPLDELIQRMWLNPSTFKIEKNVINDFNTGRTFQAEYSDFQVVDSSFCPFKVNIKIAAQKKINIKIDYSKVAHEKVASMPFNIPAKYERIR